MKNPISHFYLFFIKLFFLEIRRSIMFLFLSLSVSLFFLLSPYLLLFIVFLFFSLKYSFMILVIGYNKNKKNWQFGCHNIVLEYQYFRPITLCPTLSDSLPLSVFDYFCIKKLSVLFVSRQIIYNNSN